MYSSYAMELGNKAETGIVVFTREKRHIPKRGQIKVQIAIKAMHCIVSMLLKQFIVVACKKSI
jgi:hypothetical protein